MAIASRRSESDKVLGELERKMRLSGHDAHYTWKYWVRLNPNDATKPIDAPRDKPFFAIAMTRLMLLPVWLPYWYWKRRQTEREMIEFVVAGTSGRLRDVLDRELTEEELNFVSDVMNKEPDDVKAELRAASLLADDEFVRQLALKWVELHPRDFIFGEHDPKVAKLQRAFEEILSENA